MTIFSIGFWYTAIYAPVDIHEGEYILALNDSQFSNITKIEILHHPETASVTLDFDPTATELLKATWEHVYAGYDDLEPLDIVVEYTLAANNTLLSIDIEDSTDDQTFNFMGMMWTQINLFECVITINPVALISLYVDLDNVGVDISAQNTVFETFDIDYETGHVDVIMDNVTIQNPVNIEGFTAGNDLYFNDVIFESNFSASTISGHQDIYLTNVQVQNVDIETLSAGIDVIITETPALNVEISSTSGHIDFMGTDVILNDLSISTVSSGIDLYLNDAITSNISATSSTGHIDLYSNTIETQNIFILDSTGGIDFSLIDSEVGEVYLQRSTGFAEVLLQESIVGDITMISTSGGMDFEMLGGILQGNITVQASTGYQDIELNEISFNQSINVDIATTTGGLDLYWVHIIESVNYPVLITLETTSGHIDAELHVQSGEDGWFTWAITTETDNPSVNIETWD
ncbi:MAG: hypothetical protein ACTSYU_11305 [Promethearchaeota archaeon]